MRIQRPLYSGCGRGCLWVCVWGRLYLWKDLCRWRSHEYGAVDMICFPYVGKTPAKLVIWVVLFPKILIYCDSSRRETVFSEFNLSLFKQWMCYYVFIQCLCNKRVPIVSQWKYGNKSEKWRNSRQTFGSRQTTPLSSVPPLSTHADSRQTLWSQQLLWSRQPSALVSSSAHVSASALVTPTALVIPTAFVSACTLVAPSTLVTASALVTPALLSVPPLSSILTSWIKGHLFKTWA